MVAGCALLSFSVPQCFLLISSLRSHRKSGPHFLCREKVTKSGRGARAEGLLRKARPFGAGRPSRGDQSPHVPPCPPGGISISAARRAKEIVSQRGLPRPGPPAVRGGIWASATPWLGCRKSISPGAQKAAWNRPRNQWRARLPGPSGSLTLRRTALCLTRGRAEAWNRP